MASVYTGCGARGIAKFLALALDCQAVTLVSSDADLLVLHPWHEIPILTPAGFLTTLSGQ